ncbi:MAG: GGDEF domain-containing protein [Deltaproteobacteria bacterium]|nr:GGDEF domain-containing protein [Deltaproteobacteria bacterium]
MASPSHPVLDAHTDEGGLVELQILAKVSAAMASGEPYDALLRRILTLIAQVAGGSKAILAVTIPQLSALIAELPAATGRTVLGEQAELVSAGPSHTLLTDWEGSTEPVLLDESSKLVLPLAVGGVLVLDPIPDVIYVVPDMQLLRILTDLASGTIQSVARVAQADRRAAALEDTRRRLRERNTQLREQAVLDELTGVNNRRFFERRLDYEYERLYRYQLPLAMIMFDIDHFKVVNDTWGHPAGDEVLRQLSALAKEALRRVDTVCRIGGEEFAVIMPNTRARGAVDVAERLRASAEKLRIETAGTVIQITISLGVIAVEPDWVGQRADFFRLADEALYAAKEGGRNQVRVAEGTAL